VKSILVVDTTATTRSLVTRLLQESTGHTAVFASTEAEALAAIDKATPDAVLLQPAIDGLDGPQLVRSIHGHKSYIPIVLITVKGHEAAAIRAFSHGAANYVPRHLLKEELVPTLRSVLQIAQHRRREMQLYERLTDFRCRFELENDRSLLPLVVHYLQDHLARLRLCAQATLIRAGIAIDEALVNALYHGNLELDSDLRESDQNEYENQARERMAMDPYRHRRIRVEARISTDLARITVCDDGPGFDPHSLPDPTDPENMDKVSGRGVHLMRTFMDEVQYNETGNCVTLILRGQTCQEQGTSRPDC
jgi:DNA-binding response OmpR family regulator